MAQLLISALVVAAFFSAPSADGAFCTSGPDPGERTNDAPFDTTAHAFVRSVENGALYEAGPENARFPLLHVYGSAYEMGFAQGQIWGKAHMEKFAAGTYEYLIQGGLDALGDRLPEKFQALLIEKGLDRALDWTAEQTAPFTPQHYLDEIRGIADGAGVDYQTLLRLNMIPEVTKASCSFFGAWGDASADGHTYQLRALDYATDCDTFTDMRMVVVYHPSGGRVASVSLGWPGLVGVLTGFSEQQIGISEIGVSFSDDSFGQGTDNTPPEKVAGQPWMSVLRDVAETATGLDSALAVIENANRTCNLIIGIGSGKDGVANGVEYSGYVAVPYNDTTLLPANDTWHAQIPGVVYNGMDWDCPTYTGVLHDQLAKYRGSIDAATAVGHILPTVQTGNLHIAVTDLTDSQFFVSFMRMTTASEDEPFFAYERQFTQLDMPTLFAMPAPEVVSA
jgi:isopenicillin-N N-acyltransferase-like protein